MKSSVEPVNLLSLNSDEFKKFLDSFDHVFSDCDGVIWERTPLPGSGEFMRLMKDHGKTVNFVSNNSFRNKQSYEELFLAAGIENGLENLMTPSKAVVEYLRSINFDKKIYCVTCPETISVLEANGFKCKNEPTVSSEYQEDYSQYLKDDAEIGAVLFDCDIYINMIKLQKASTYLNRPEVLFISGATDKRIPFRGRLIVGTGAFTDIVSEHVNRNPIQLGKPSKLFGELAMKQAKVTDPSRVLFIGDMIEQDIALGKEVGFKTLLVLTSLTKQDMLSHETIKPDYYVESLGNLVPLL